MERRASYPTDVTDEQWSRLEPLIQAVLYQLRGGAAWRMMPRDLPPWGITYQYWRAWRKDGTWERAHDTLRAARCGRQWGKMRNPARELWTVNR